MSTENQTLETIVAIHKAMDTEELSRKEVFLLACEQAGLNDIAEEFWTYLNSYPSL